MGFDSIEVRYLPIFANLSIFDIDVMRHLIHILTSSFKVESRFIKIQNLSKYWNK